MLSPEILEIYIYISDTALKSKSSINRSNDHASVGWTYGASRRWTYFQENAHWWTNAWRTAQNKSNKRYKYCIKHGLKNKCLSYENWKREAKDRRLWRAKNGIETGLEQHVVQMKRAVRKMDDLKVAALFSCHHCDQVCFSKGRLICHMWSHDNQYSIPLWRISKANVV